MTFERVQKTRGGSSVTEPPRLAVYPSGGARFNKAASDEYLADVDVVEFYVDPDVCQLGIARGGDPDDAWKLSSDGPGHGVSFRTTLSEFGVSVDAIESTIYLDIEHDPSEGLLIADADPLLEAAEVSDS